MTQISMPQTADRKLDLSVKLKVCALMARGEKYATIQKFLKDKFNIDYTTSSLSMFRKRNSETIADMERLVLDAEVAEVERVRSKSLRMLNRKLDRASTDDLEIQQLDEDYRTGKIELSEYKRKKAGLIDLSVKDLATLSEKMHSQMKNGPGAPGGDGGSNAPALDGKLLSKLMAAIQSGDILTLTQLTLKTNATPHHLDATEV